MNDMDTDMTTAVLRLEAVRKTLHDVMRKREWTIGEMRTARDLLLATVRQNIDPYALGHAPDKRHY